VNRITLEEIEESLTAAGFDRPVWQYFSTANASTATVNGVLIRVLWSQWGDRVDASIDGKGNFVRNPADLPALVRELLDTRAQQIAAREQ
jgi:hypothetical protein